MSTTTIARADISPAPAEKVTQIKKIISAPKKTAKKAESAAALVEKALSLPPPAGGPPPALPQTIVLIITRFGNGMGSVESAPLGIDCGSVCRHSFARETEVALTAHPMAGSQFFGWSAPCSGAGLCRVTLAGATTISARFEREEAVALKAPASGGAAPTNSASTNSPPVNQTATTNPVPANEPPPSSSPEPISFSNVNHLLLSEVLYDAAGADTGKEFVELYNPSGVSLDLADWTLGFVNASGAVSTLAKIGTKTGDTTTIASHGFFLVGLNAYAGALAADIVRSASLPNTAGTLQLKNKDGTIIDELIYGGALATGADIGASVERKAWQSGCSSALGSGAGNGCDNDLLTDFDIRVNPEPQSSVSAAE